MVNINELPYLNTETVTLETMEKIRAAVGFLKEEYSQTVTGLWYLAQSGCDGEIRVILRTELNIGTTDYLFLEGRLSKLLGGCIVYDYNEDVLNAEQREDIIADIQSELENGQAFTLYAVYEEGEGA